jgi:hypothetical protein
MAFYLLPSSAITLVIIVTFVACVFLFFFYYYNLDVHCLCNPRLVSILES